MAQPRSEKTWLCVSCNHPIRAKKNPKLGEAHYEHHPAIPSSHMAIRGADRQKEGQK